MAPPCPLQAFLELSTTTPDAGPFLRGPGGAAAGGFGGGAAAAPDKWVARLAGRKPATAAEVDAAVGRLAAVLAGQGIPLQLDRCEPRRCAGPWCALCICLRACCNCYMGVQVRKS